MYDNLRAEMARKDLHQRELAESIGIAQQSLRNKLRGKCDFKLREIREIAEAADYDLSKIKKAYEYMQNYGTDIDVPIAFMKDCIKKGYYNTESKPKAAKNNSINNFSQRTDYDFEELERKLLEN